MPDMDAELKKALTAKLAEALRGDKTQINFPCAMAQAMELTDRYYEMMAPSALQAGDLCVAKEIFDHQPDHVHGKMVHVLLFPIDIENPMHSLYLHKWAENFDVEPDSDWFAGIVSPQGLFCIRPVSRNRLRPLTDAERNGKD